jgi:hypothetical protein
MKIQNITSLSIASIKINKNLKEKAVMANNKKLVEAITSMEEDFAQWYTDVVKKRI